MATLRKKSEKLFRLFFNHPYSSFFNHPYARFPIIPIQVFQSSLSKVSNHPCPFYPTYNISISVADGGGHSLTGSDRDCTNIKIIFVHSAIMMMVILL